MVPVIKLKDGIREIAGRPWYPIEVARINDQVIRMALVKGEYHWHKHEEEDELFFVIEGEIIIQRKNQEELIVKKGEMVVIPRKIEHKPVSKEKSFVLLFEPKKLKSRGDE